MSKSSGGKRSGKGSHGSTTKAGKVRQQTPKIPATNLRKSKIPRINARRKYHYRFELDYDPKTRTAGRKVGQDWFLLEKKKKR